MVEWHREGAAESAGREAEAEAQVQRWKRGCEAEETACRAAEERLRLLACERDAASHQLACYASDLSRATHEVRPPHPPGAPTLYNPVIAN